jgi:predicted HicB family RNase H-like nuclease
VSEKRVQMNVDVPAELKAAIQAEAAERNISYSDAAVEKLAERHSVEFETRPLSKVVPERRPNPTQLALKMPERLRRKINAAAARRGTVGSVVAREALVEAYEVAAA